MYSGPATFDPDFLLSETQASDLTGLSTRTLQAWRVRGEGPRFVKVGRAVRYRRRDVVAWIEQNTLASTSQRPASAVRG